MFVNGHFTKQRDFKNIPRQQMIIQSLRAFRGALWVPCVSVLCGCPFWKYIWTAIQGYLCLGDDCGTSFWMSFVDSWIAYIYLSPLQHFGRSPVPFELMHFRIFCSVSFWCPLWKCVRAMSTLCLFLHNEFWEVAWGTFPSICSRICVIASRIVELSCLCWSARGLWKVIFQVSDAIRVQAAPGGPFSDL